MGVIGRRRPPLLSRGGRARGRLFCESLDLLAGLQERKKRPVRWQTEAVRGVGRGWLGCWWREDGIFGKWLLITQ